MSPTAINVRETGCYQITSKRWSTKGLEYAEDLLYKILDAKGVGPVYRLLFGLRCTRQGIWLAPNVKLADIIDRRSKKNNSPTDPRGDVTLDLRMRYRPSSFTKLAILDAVVFDMVFAQVRYDFVHRKFSNEAKDFLLLNDSVLGLIATDLIRHASEHNLDVDEIFKKSNYKQFVPKRASNWQRPLIYYMPDKFNLKKSISTGIRNSDNDIVRIKRAFLEGFLRDVCPDYGVDVYSVKCLDDPEYRKAIQVRVRYHQDDNDAICVIETKAKERLNPTSKAVVIWKRLCDIYTISYGTLRLNIVEINRSNGRPFRIRFESELHAKSFLSQIDGYYRLMRKWYFNFCRDVASPDLDRLKRNKSHGPIGFESSRSKLRKYKGGGRFLVRRCMRQMNKYLIDTYLEGSIMLSFIVEQDTSLDVFKFLEFKTYPPKGVTVEVFQREKNYISLRDLIADIEVYVKDPTKLSLNTNQQNVDTITKKAIPLNDWIPPSEYDDCPGLLLSISKKGLKELELKTDGRHMTAEGEFPKLIPAPMIYHSNDKSVVSTNNGLTVIVGSFNNRLIIVKKINETRCGSHDINFIPIRDRMYNEDNSNRISDWVFLKSPLLAETIGIEMHSLSVLQEYLPLGPLDKYLGKNKNLSEIDRRSLACQLAQALLFLQAKCMVHGKIRCHNLYVKKINPIQIRLTDWLGSIDVATDQAFLADECIYRNLDRIFKSYHPGIDVWSFGTTVWQIYNNGIRPAPRTHANTLPRPPGCPDQIWFLVQSCWIHESSTRVSPQVIYRDLNDSLVWEREVHSYDLIEYDKVSDDTISQVSSINSSGNSSSSNNNNGSHIAAKSPDQNSIRATSSNGTNLLPKQLTNGHSRAHQTNLTTFDGVTSADGTPYYRFGALKSLAQLFHLPTFGGSTRTNSTSGGDVYLSMTNSDSSANGTSQSTTLTTYSSDTYIDPMWLIDSDKLKMGPEIGRGSGGVVRKAVLDQWDGLQEEVVAVKCIYGKSSMQLAHAHHLVDLRREFEILRQLRHKNIVKVYGIVEEGQMVVEYMPLGCLLLRLRNSEPERVLEMPLLKYATDIASGMEYLESKRVIHRDLALRNILLASEQEAKICDFGLAQMLGPANDYKLKTDRALPLRWYAPETLSSLVFTHQTDVWSFGIVLWEIYSGGQSPQYSGHQEHLAETLKRERLPMPHNCPSAIYEIMMACWSYQADERPTFVELRNRLESLSE